MSARLSTGVGPAVETLPDQLANIELPLRRARGRSAALACCALLTALSLLGASIPSAAAGAQPAAATDSTKENKAVGKQAVRSQVKDARQAEKNKGSRNPEQQQRAAQASQKPAARVKEKKGNVSKRTNAQESADHPPRSRECATPEEIARLQEMVHSLRAKLEQLK